MRKELHKDLKETFKTELAKLPDHLKAMTPKERTDTLIKLLPFVLPKQSSVNHDVSEPDMFDGLPMG